MANEAKHTPGFVKIRDGFPRQITGGFRGRIVADTCGDDAVANARRFVACWNACEGIDTEQLEPKMLGNQIAAKMEVIEQRTALVAAITGLLNCTELNLDDMEDDTRTAIETARALIDGKTSPAQQGERAEIPLSSANAIRKAHDALSDSLEGPYGDADEIRMIRAAAVTMCAVLNAAGL